MHAYMQYASEGYLTRHVRPILLIFLFSFSFSFFSFEVQSLVPPSNPSVSLPQPELFLELLLQFTTIALENGNTVETIVNGILPNVFAPAFGQRVSNILFSQDCVCVCFFFFVFLLSFSLFFPLQKSIDKQTNK